MRLFAAATVALVLLLGQAAGEELVEERESSEAAETTTEQQAVSEPPIKLVHVLNPGEREYLSPNLIGVQNIAMTFLPLSMNFVNIIDAFREITSGVRYEILLNAENTKVKPPAEADTICRLVILEKPWLRTQWGDKHRELVTSNCTDSAENSVGGEPEDKARLLNEKYVSNSIFNGGQRNELTDAEMVNLESQILTNLGPLKRKVSLTKSAPASPAAPPAPPATAAAASPAADSDAPISTSITVTKWTPPAPESANEATTALSIDEAEKKVEKAKAKAEERPDAEEGVTSTAIATELNDNEKRWLDDFLSVGAYNFEKNHQGSKEQQQRVEEQEEEEQRQQETTPEEKDPEVLRSRRSLNDIPLGGAKPYDEEAAKVQLQGSLDKLTEGEGPHYKIAKVYSASRQVVSGTLTRIDADLIDGSGAQHRCIVEIWSQVWTKTPTHDITFKCRNQPVVQARHSRSVEWAEKKTHKKHSHRALDKVEHLFHKFQVRFGRRYVSTAERQMRLRIFRQNLKTIEELNANEMGSAKYGITEFADMTSSEYKERTGLWQRDEAKPTGGAQASVPSYAGELPKEFDWRKKNAVTQVKNQGSCGSCWAFSVTGNIEGQYALKYGELKEFSEQELLDCDTTDSACNGGLMDNAYKAIKDIGGLEYEAEYPYKAKKNQCHFNKTLSHVQVSGFVDLPAGNETAMQEWLLANGPISIGLNANAMQFYRGGVSHPWKALCSKKNLDHGVLVVGYGVSDYPNFHKTLPYWIIKNSWGPRWGEQGYYRVYRGDNTCGVAEMATSAVLA